MEKILFILVITWGISNITSLKVNANSKNIIVKNGQGFNISCKSDQAIKTCVLISPSKHMHTVWAGTQDGSIPYKAENGRISRYGNGNFHCGIHVSNALAIDQGRWSCDIYTHSTVNNETKMSRMIKVTVHTPPKSVLLRINGLLVNSTYSIKISNNSLAKEIELECITGKSSPSPEFNWKIGMQKLRAFRPMNESSRAIGYADKMKLNISYKYHEKVLMCIVSHEGHTTSQINSSMNLVRVTIIVYSPPVVISRIQSNDDVKVGGALKVRTIFFANPKPNVGHWIISGNNTLQVGSSNAQKDYYSSNITDWDEEGNQFYADLIFGNITIGDISEFYTLVVTNTEGKMKYQFKIDLLETSCMKQLVTAVLLSMLFTLSLSAMFVIFSSIIWNNISDKRKPNANEKSQSFQYFTGSKINRLNRHANKKL